MSVPKKWHVGRDLNQLFINAVREVLGLDPLFSHDLPDEERFYRSPTPWGRVDGMVRRTPLP